MNCKRLRFSSCAFSALLSGVGLMSSGIVLLALLSEDDYFFPGLMCLAGFVAFVFGFIWMCNPGAAELEQERRRSAVASVSREGSICSLQRPHKMSLAHKGSTAGLEEGGGSSYNLNSIAVPPGGSRRSSAVSRVSVSVSLKDMSDETDRCKADNGIIKNKEANNVSDKQAELRDA